MALPADDASTGRVVVGHVNWYVGPWHAMVVDSRPGCKATGPLCTQHCQEPCEDDYELEIQHLDENGVDGKDDYTCRMEPGGPVGPDGEYYDWYHVNCNLGLEYQDTDVLYFDWPDEACYTSEAGPKSGEYRVRYLLEGPDYWGEFEDVIIQVQLVQESE